MDRAELKKKVDVLEKNSNLVTGSKSLENGTFRLNFNEYADKEIQSLGFRTADGCIFVNIHGIYGVDYNSSGLREINYKVTDRNAVQTVLAYAESKGFPIGKGLAEKVGYEVGMFDPKKEEFKEFSSDDEAVEYAEKNIGKYNAEIVKIEGKKTLLSATGLPMEDRFRDPIEQIVRDFIKEMGEDPENMDMEDVVMYIGAQLEGTLEDLIEKNTGLRILSAGQEY